MPDEKRIGIGPLRKGDLSADARDRQGGHGVRAVYGTMERRPLGEKNRQAADERIAGAGGVYRVDPDGRDMLYSLAGGY